MKIRLKHKMSFEEADMLIEKYYEALTSAEEEKRLREFLSQPDLPERYEAEKAIFGYFGKKKEKKQYNFQSFVRWTSVAAAVAVIVLSIKIFDNNPTVGYAFINGQEITDVQTIKSLAISSLTDVSSANNDVEDGLKDIQGNEAIEEQLNVFSGLEL